MTIAAYGESVGVLWEPEWPLGKHLFITSLIFFNLLSDLSRIVFNEYSKVAAALVQNLKRQESDPRLRRIFCDSKT